MTNPHATGARRLRQAVYAATIVLAPLALIPGTIFNPGIGGIGQGAANIAANATADSLTNDIHVAIYVLESFLLPLSVLGLAGLALDKSPWLATIGGGLGLIGWIPWSALAAQDDLTLQMARLGNSAQYVALWNRFTTDGAMLTLTLVYIAAHLVAYVLLPIALIRARIIPGWAAWSLGLTSPLTIVAFASRQHALLPAVCVLWLAGSVPAAVVLLRTHGEPPGPASPQPALN
jgi:hypothetical protein